jgi:hypothetical protein
MSKTPQHHDSTTAVERIDVSVYTIPTDAPDADGCPGSRGCPGLHGVAVEPVCSRK